MINTIFLDVDGVLVSFRKGIYDAFGKHYDYFQMSNKWVFWDNWPEVTPKKVNDICTFEFWRNLEWIYDGHDILRVVVGKFDPDRIYLLTTPMPNVESATGKWQWVREHLPEFYKRTIITQAPKSIFARPDALLIDDNNENIDSFIEAGGQGLLVPRSYNRAYENADNSPKIIREYLETLC